MKKGFTLAEVLITLAVIGVVAALTIPTVVHKYQQKQMYTQFMKVYNSLANAMDLVIMENGDTENWDWEEPGNNPFENYIIPQLKVSKTCDNASDCFSSEYTSLSGDDTYTFNELAEYANAKSVVLADGAVLNTGHSGETTIFYVDTNGKKGPNVFGRDFFILDYYDSDSSARPGFALDDYETNTEPDESGDIRANCNPSIKTEENGRGCPSRMVAEGKMDY